MDHAINFYNVNYENNFNIAIANIDIKKNHIYSSYIYSNIDNK